MADQQLRLGVIIASVRPGRVGDKVGAWVAEQARQHGGLDVEVIDLADVDLPAQTEEPNHPRTGDYLHNHTRAWSRRVAACQAFIIVTAAGLVPVPRDSGRRTGNLHRPVRYPRKLRRVFYLSAQSAMMRE